MKTEDLQRLCALVDMDKVRADAAERAKRFPLWHLTDAHTGELLAVHRSDERISIMDMCKPFMAEHPEINFTEVEAV